MAACKGCGAEIVWCTNPATGRKIPLDVKPTVYHLMEGPRGMECIKAEDQALIGVSHFATCPYADRFSKGGGTQ